MKTSQLELEIHKIKENLNLKYMRRTYYFSPNPHLEREIYHLETNLKHKKIALNPEKYKTFIQGIK